MVITHHGGQCFKVSFGETTLAFDPISKLSKTFTPAKFGSDVAFISMHHANFDGAEQVALGAKQPFVVSGPGEYEIGDVTARGFGVATTYDGKDRFVTIYQVKLEDMNIIFLGALGSAEIDPKILGEFGDIDILFIPIGGGEVLEVPEALKLSVKLEAKIIIPMHYNKDALKAFLKENGSEATVPQDKLTIKKKDLLGSTGQIAVIES